MAILNYWVGQIPFTPVAITVNDELNNKVNLSQYTSIVVTLLGSDNENLDTSGIVLNTTGSSEGRLVLRFPSDRSLFNKSGRYLLQLKLSNPNALDFTDEQTIIVRRRGEK